MLPSSREFARTLLLARGTVVRAYGQLIGKGLIEAIKGKGLIVNAPPPLDYSTQSAQMHELMLVDDLSANEILGSAQQPLPVEDVTKAAVPQALLPVKRWRELIIKNCKQLGRTDEIDDLGALDLRQQVCRFLRATRGLNCSPEQISVYTNTDQALDTIARLLIKPNDTAVIEEPGYIGVSKIFAAAGARVIANGIDYGGMMVENLDALATSPKVLYVTPVSQDPTGIVMSEERQDSIIQWAKRNDCLIVEDGWDTDFCHGRPAVPCMQQKAAEQIIYLYSFWKLLFPLSNACFLVVPQRLVPALRRLRAMINRPPISIELSALKDLLAAGEIDNLVAKLQKSYRKRRQALIYSLSMAFEKQIQIAPMSGGTHVLVSFQFAAEKQRVLDAGAECGLKLISLDEYYFDGRVTNQYIVFFTNVSPATVGAQAQLFKERLLGADYMAQRALL